MIEVLSVTKRFGDVRALDGVSFTARDGRITGLLGPNGAGKSTCLRILSTVLRPDRGSARIGGVDVVAEPLRARRLMGVLPHAAGLYPHLTARENIEYYRRLHGLGEAAPAARLDALLGQLGLAAIAARRRPLPAPHRAREHRVLRPTARSRRSRARGPRRRAPRAARPRRDRRSQGQRLLAGRADQGRARAGACPRAQALAARRADQR